MWPFLALAVISIPPMVQFPGTQTSVRSPTSAARVFYVEMGSDEGGQNFSLRFDRGHGAPIILRRFDRSVDVGWSPSGRHFFVNDHVGSNSADCLIVRPVGTNVHGVSLKRLIARNPGRPRYRAIPSQYYVHCNGWRSETVMRAAAVARTDDGATLEDSFTYDARTGLISWQSTTGTRRATAVSRPGSSN